MVYRNIQIFFPMTGGNIGGSHITLLAIIENLPSHIIPIVFLDQKGAFAKLLESKGIPYSLIENNRISPYSKNFLKVIKNWVKNFRYWRKIWKDLKIDIIHVSDDPFPQTCLLYSYLTGIPCIFHHHILLHRSRLLKISCLFSKYNIFVSRFLQQAFYKRFKNHTDLLLPNPISAQEHLLSTSQKLPIRIGFFSNLYYQKRPFILVDSIGKLIERGYEVEGYFFGNTADISHDELKKYIISKGLESSIYIHHFTYPIISQLSSMHILVSPGRHEAFGRVIIEAMAVGVVTVASRDGGHREIIVENETGYFFELDNAEDLTNKLEWIICHPKEREIVRKKAHAIIRKDYSHEEYMKKLISYYESILKKRHRFFP